MAEQDSKVTPEPDDPIIDGFGRPLLSTCMVGMGFAFGLSSWLGTTQVFAGAYLFAGIILLSVARLMYTREKKHSLFTNGAAFIGCAFIGLSLGIFVLPFVG